MSSKANFTLLLALVFASLLLRWAISLHPHSGFGVEPLHGDFEAQRHWVEITMNLKTKHDDAAKKSTTMTLVNASRDWYRDTPDNDLQYWGLDYPPWSAFHAMLIGKTVERVLYLFSNENKFLSPSAVVSSAEIIMNTTFGLHQSRGAEDYKTILIMRLSSLITDILCYIVPVAIFYFTFAYNNAILSAGGQQQCHCQDWAALIFLFAPIPQIFIDHGHFQFNSVPAGLVLTCIALLTKFQANWTSPSAGTKTAAAIDGVCAFLASSAVMFKQMSLYFAPAIAVVLLFRTLCLSKSDDADENKQQQQQHNQVSILDTKGVAKKKIFGEVKEKTEANKKQSAKEREQLDKQRKKGSAAGLHHIVFRMAVAFCCGILGFVLPFLIPGYPLVLADVVTRMFPFQRGLYEDKVANFWCAVSPVFKLPNYVPSREWVVRVCAITTIVAFLPAAKNFFVASVAERRFSRQRVATLLTVSALCFFLFSFQVHEKSILMAVTSTVAIWVGQDARQPRYATTRLACAHFMLAAMVSLQPLAIKDRLEGGVWCSLSLLACLAASVDAARTLAYAERIIGDDDSEESDEDEAARYARNSGKAAPPPAPPLKDKKDEPHQVASARRKLYLYYVSLFSLMFVSCVAPLIIEPSEALPDILPVMNSFVCCCHFVWYLVYWTRHLNQPF